MTRARYVPASRLDAACRVADAARAEASTLRARVAELEKENACVMCGERIAAIERLVRERDEARSAADVLKPRVAHAEASVAELEGAVNASCTCGGMGPNDDGACPACMVWHRIRALASAPPGSKA